VALAPLKLGTSMRIARSIPCFARRSMTTQMEIPRCAAFLIDGSYPRSCSVRNCAPELMNLAEALAAKRRFGDYVEQRTRESKERQG
jgi:hypothetical protein